MGRKRGIKYINSLFTVAPLPEDEAQLQGRSPELLRQRNERMCARLYYLRREYELYSGDAIMELLVWEFELSATMIAKTMKEDEYLRYMRRLLKECPDKGYFKKRWPLMMWDNVMPLREKYLKEK